MRKKAIIAFLSLYIGITILGFEARAENIQLTVSAKSFVLIDLISGRILLEKNSEEKRAMASTTKIMTAIIALEKGYIKSRVKVSPRAASVGGSSFHLSTGEVLSLENMLYGLLLPSGNDASIAIAEHIGGTEENFVHMMNEKALELGALSTHFTNPHGLDNPKHYTTAKDLALIARYALSSNKFCNIVQTKTKEIKDGNYPRQILNTNRLLWEFEGTNGIKTGYTGNAGKCLVASAGRNNLQLLSIVLGTDNHFSDSFTLLNYGFVNYKLTPIISKNKYCTTVSVQNGCYDKVGLMTKDDINIALKENEIVTFNLIIPKKIKAPVYKGENIGELQVYIKNDLIFSNPLIAMSDVRVKKYNDILYKILRLWMKGNSRIKNENLSKKLNCEKDFRFLWRSNIIKELINDEEVYLMTDPYKKGMFKVNPYAKKKPLKGNLVVVLDGKYDKRGLQLIPQASRCLTADEVHEMILTDEDKKPGDTINKIAYIGFFAVKESAVIIVGDKVMINGQGIGKIAGFDETHIPNHYNIVIYGKDRISGSERNLDLNAEVIIG